MKFTKILVQIAALYVFYMVGTWVQEMLNIPIPKFNWNVPLTCFT